MNSGGDTGNAPRPVDMIICDIIENAAAPERPTGLQVEQPQRPQRSRAKRRPGSGSGSAHSVGERERSGDEFSAETPSRQAETGDDLFGPRTSGFDIDAMNSEFALVLMGGDAVVFVEQPHAVIEEERRRFISVSGFCRWYCNRFTEVTVGGRVKLMTWADAWLRSRHRRSYRGIEFYPDPDNKPGTPDHLNLWSGFAVTPTAKPNTKAYKTFRDHLLTNVCGGDESLFKWVFGFFAHVVQRPRERIGVALVMRGRMGSGKTKVGEVFGSLFPRHFFLVDHPRYVTGQFNAHMATCLLLQADEAVWAGDKSAEGRLKGLVTAPVQQIEAKGIDPIRLPNYVRLIMTSNEEWVVPAGKDERRFCVLDVDPRCAQDSAYFREMDEELAAGGLAHLLADLLAFDLSSINLRQIPRTAALLEQKIRSLDLVEAWWFERLMSGATTRDGSEWGALVPCTTLFNDYIAIADKIGVRRKQEETVFGIRLRKLVPDLDHVRRSTEVKRDDGVIAQKRAWCYALPSLERAREEFERLLGQRVEWPHDDAEAVAGTREDVDDVTF